MLFKNPFKKAKTDSSFTEQEEKFIASFHNTENSAETPKQNNSDKNAPVTFDDVYRLSKEAERFIKMFEVVHKDAEPRLLFAAGITGYVCHETVKEKGEKFIELGTKDGRKFYFGDAVNSYLLENNYSVLSFLNGYYKNKFPEREVPDIHAFAKRGVDNAGNENYLIWGKFPPDEVYKLVRKSWFGIYQKTTAEVCKSADEWSVLFGIVLQGVLLHIDGNPDELYGKALECAMHLSKMDDGSISVYN